MSGKETTMKPPEPKEALEELYSRMLEAADNMGTLDLNIPETVSAFRQEFLSLLTKEQWLAVSEFLTEYDIWGLYREKEEYEEDWESSECFDDWSDIEDV
jgi:dsDNA-binding SOS-regulon protein